MSGSTSSVAAMSVEGGSAVQGVPQLSEVVVEVTNFEGDYGRDWDWVREEVDGTHRMDEDKRRETARVYFVVSDRSVREIEGYAFGGTAI